jgi:NADP-dependent 3-hydroxy acid dehydrogenase YdfG
LLKDKNVLITGATSGIGRAIAQKLLEKNANVACCGQSEEKIKSLIDEHYSFNSKKIYKAFDIVNENEILTFIEESSAAIGEIDILINCAGVNSERANVESISTQKLRHMIDINMIAPFIFIREIYNQMINRKSGTIINVLSTVCRFSNEGIASYTASKAGLDAFVKVLRKEARQYNIKICSIYPGGVDTDFRTEPRPQYLSADIVADSVLSLIKLNNQSCMDELVIRPLVEKNYS